MSSYRGRGKNRKKRFPIRFICEPNYMVVHVDYHNLDRTLFIKLMTKEEGIVRVKRSVFPTTRKTEPTDAEIKKKVIDFCSDLVNNGIRSSEDTVVRCSEDISRVDTILGLTIWRRRHANPYNLNV